MKWKEAFDDMIMMTTSFLYKSVIPLALKNSTNNSAFSKGFLSCSSAIFCNHKYWHTNAPPEFQLFLKSSRGPVFLEHCCYLQKSSAIMAKTALVIVAHGSEEIEAVTPIDTLRRAGIEVTVAGLSGSGDLILSRNVIVKAEKSLKDALASAPFDAVILPGGAKGSEAFVESDEVGELLREQEQSGRLIAAICAAPTALHKHGICVGRSVTSYPAMKDKMLDGGKYQYKEDRVVKDGNLITSRGPGTSLEFSLALVAYLVGQEKADEIGKAMLVQ